MPSLIISKLVLCSDLETGFDAYAKRQGRVRSGDPNILVVTPEETTIGIEPIRDLQIALNIPPSGGLTRLVCLGPAEKITLPAQQALLKLLEEPPERTEIALFAFAVSDVIPTVLSRCELIDLREKREEVISTFLEPLSRAKTTKEKMLLFAQVPAQRDAARAFLIQELRATGKTPVSKNIVVIRQKTLEVLEALQANVSPALCIDQYLT